MPRLSLYRPNRTNDYRFFDRTISEMYTVGGVDLYIHKYLGPKTGTGDSAESGNFDPTQPNYTFEDPLFIQDILLGENRDRSYDPDIYRMRGVYNVQDLDFNLTQFGLFIQQDTLYITFHYNDMIDTLGRKLMSGDVIEIPNLKDWNPLNPAVLPLPRFYVIQDAAFASEGFSQTWLPHTWRVKASPLVNSQEYSDIVKQCNDNNQIWDPGNFYPSGSVVLYGEDHYIAIQNVPVGTEITDTAYWATRDCTTIEDTATTRPKDLQINDAILAAAELEVPLSGYDTVRFYIWPTNPDGTPGDPGGVTVDNTIVTADGSPAPNASDAAQTPRGDGYTMGYLTGDGIAPNGLPVTPGVSFPLNPQQGEFCLRLDYFPNRLFRYDGRRWLKIEENVRTDLTNGPSNDTLRSSFVNNTYTVRTTDQGNIPSRQSLSELLKPRADNGNDGGNKPPDPYPNTQPGQKSS